MMKYHSNKPKPVKSFTEIYTDEIVLQLPDMRLFKDGWLSCDSMAEWWFHPAGSTIETWEKPTYNAWVSDDMLEMLFVDMECLPDLSDNWYSTLICTRYLEKLQKSARNKEEEFWARKKLERTA